MRDTLHIAEACAGEEIRAALSQVVTYIYFGERPMFLLQAHKKQLKLRRLHGSYCFLLEKDRMKKR